MYYSQDVKWNTPSPELQTSLLSRCESDFECEFGNASGRQFGALSAQSVNARNLHATFSRSVNTASLPRNIDGTITEVSGWSGLSECRESSGIGQRGMTAEAADADTQKVDDTITAMSLIVSAHTASKPARFG